MTQSLGHPCEVYLCGSHATIEGYYRRPLQKLADRLARDPRAASNTDAWCATARGAQNRAACSPNVMRLASSLGLNIGVFL